jgi:branched-chain amino acid transport system ATP-binding protein
MSEAILQASGIVKRYGKFTALSEVDLRILPRTVHSVIGPNGAGKTTLFHVLTGTLPITAGKITFDGHDVTHEPITSACAAASRVRFRSRACSPI